MKTERRRLGIRVRVILNRGELKHAARMQAAADEAVPPNSPRRGTYRFPADPGRGQNQPIALTAAALEKACRSWLRERGEETPRPDAGFKVTADPDGGPPEAAIFQWWELTPVEDGA